MEIWKDIEGYEGLYQVSNLGNVRSLDRLVVYSDGRKYFYNGVVLKFGNCKGYRTAGLRVNNNVKMARVNRLVAKAFIPNPNNYPEVNHKDEDTKNDNVDNLEWCTSKYNNNYGTSRKRAYETYKKNSRKFKCIETNKIYASLKECAEELGVLKTGIGNVLKHRAHKHSGYRFIYLDELQEGMIKVC